MAMQWTPPSKGTALNGASAIAGLVATRNELIGWGPRVSQWWGSVSSHPVEAIALAVAVLLLVYAHWRWLLRLVGIRESPGPRWSNDKELGDEVLGWLRPRGTVTDTTAESRAKAKGQMDVAFTFAVSVLNRPISIIKMANADSIQFTGHVVPDGAHVATIIGMDEQAYSAMKEDIGLELVKFGMPNVIAERIVAQRRQKEDDAGNELPVGVFIADQLPVSTLTESALIDAANFIVRGVAIGQFLIRKHVLIEDAYRGRFTPSADIDPALSVAVAMPMTPLSSGTATPPPT